MNSIEEWDEKASCYCLSNVSPIEYEELNDSED